VKKKKHIETWVF